VAVVPRALHGRPSFRRALRSSAGKEATATADGLSFKVAPIQVDANACQSVPAGELGPVLMKIDVEVKPLK